MKLIKDEFTDLDITPQRRYQLRNPEKTAEDTAKWKKSDKAREYNKRYYEKRKLSTS